MLGDCPTRMTSRAAEGGLSSGQSTPLCILPCSATGLSTYTIAELTIWRPSASVTTSVVSCHLTMRPSGSPYLISPKSPVPTLGQYHTSSFMLCVYAATSDPQYFGSSPALSDA